MNLSRTTLIALFIIAISYSVYAQEITYRSTLKNNKGVPIDYATVVLLNSNAQAITVGASDTDGTFTITGEDAKFLEISHVAYLRKRVTLDHHLPEVIVLDESDIELDELVISAERPQMKILENGIPSYDVEALFQKTTVTNAYEMLMRLPGVTEENGSPSLIGTSSLTIIINGKRPNLPQSQLLQMLKQIPLDAVQNAEVSYNPIAKYGAEGGSINIVLKPQATGDDEVTTLAGEVNSYYDQRYFANGGGGGYFSYGGKNLSARMSYDYSGNKERSDMFVEVTPQDAGATGLTPIISENRGFYRYDAHKAFLNLTYSLPKHEVSLDAYTTTTPKSTNNEEVHEMGYHTMMEKVPSSNTFHISGDYTYDGHLRIGAFYTVFHRLRSMHIKTDRSFDNSFSSYIVDNRQNNYVWGGSVDNEHHLNKGWKVNYGANFLHSSTDDRVDYSEQKGTYNLEDVKSSYSELSVGGYLGVEKQMTDRLNFYLGLVGTYMDFEVDHQGYVAPQVKLTYMISPTDMLQFGFDTQDTYPTYWERQPFTDLKSKYQEWVGNPDLRPYTSYNSRLIYILKGKYVFQITDSYAPNYFVQLLHYDKDKERIVYNTQNWAYKNSFSLISVVPFSFWDRMQSRIILNATLQSEKADNINGISFNHNRVLFYSSLFNSIQISKAKKISWDLSLSYITGGVQGYYVFSDIFNISTGLKWVSQNDRWTIALNANDLLNRQVPKISSDISSQKICFIPPQDSRSIKLTIKYNFGNFKRKDPSHLDTSRF
ncbi:outer membrane beta-barrel protein [Porphyromonadaceae bacterium W3.11]|nr:outer membrane beta-barrel protein [Porphyromonadaceae bacterium W3.11]